MNLLITVLLFILGLFLIIKGGDIFVSSASSIADATRIPKFIIGATVVSLATTLPELIVSIIATSEGKVDMAIGNAVGSVTANIGIIMAISILFIPVAINRKSFSFKSILLVLSIILLTCLCSLGGLHFWGAVAMFIFVIAFFYDNIVSAKKNNITQEKTFYNKKMIIKNIVFLVIGTIGIVWGSNLLVNNGSALALKIGISEKIIGFTAVAIGTSLPELITTISAIIKKEPNLSIGNIIGANIIDICLILPICSFVHGGVLPVSKTILTVDMPVCFFLCVFAVIPTIFQKKFMRWQGILMIATYLSYLVYIVL